MPPAGKIESVLRKLMEFRENGTLPAQTTYVELARQFDVSVATIRRALARMEDSVQTIHGRGVQFLEEAAITAQGEKRFVVLILTQPGASGNFDAFQAGAEELLLHSKHRFPNQVEFLRLGIGGDTSQRTMRKVIELADACIVWSDSELELIRVALAERPGPRIPVIVVNPTLPATTLHPGEVEVRSDAQAGVKALLAHMSQQLDPTQREFPTVILFATDRDDDDSQSWVRAYKDELRQHSLVQRIFPVDASLVFPKRNQPSDIGRPGYVYGINGEMKARAMTLKLLEERGFDAVKAGDTTWQAEPPVGIVCLGEGVARGVLDSLSKNKLQAGRHVYLAEIDKDGSDPGSFLTTLSPDYWEMGAEAGRILMTGGAASGATAEARVRQIPPRLSRRRSTADWALQFWRVAPPSVIKRLDGTVLYANPLFEMLVDCPSKELRHAKPTEYWPIMGLAMERADQRIVEAGEAGPPVATVERFRSRNYTGDRFTYRFFIPGTETEEPLIGSMGFTISSGREGGAASPRGETTQAPMQFHWKPLNGLIEGMGAPDDPPDSIIQRFLDAVPVSIAVRNVAVAPVGDSFVYHHMLVNSLLNRILGIDRGTVSWPEQVIPRKGGISEKLCSKLNDLYRGLDNARPLNGISDEPLTLSNKGAHQGRYVIRYPMLDGFWNVTAECSLGISEESGARLSAILEQPPQPGDIEELPSWTLDGPHVYGERIFAEISRRGAAAEKSLS